MKFLHKGFEKFCQWCEIAPPPSSAVLQEISRKKHDHLTAKQGTPPADLVFRQIITVKEQDYDTLLALMLYDKCFAFCADLMQ